MQETAETQSTEEKKISHPYLDVLQKTLDKHYALLKCLELRNKLLADSREEKDEYNKNESDILTFKTEREIMTIKSVIKEKEKYFSEFIQQFIKDKEEMDKRYDDMLKNAKMLSDPSKRPDIYNLLNSVKWDVVETDIEVKLNLYKRLKNLMVSK